MKGSTMIRIVAEPMSSSTFDECLEHSIALCKAAEAREGMGRRLLESLLRGHSRRSFEELRLIEYNTMRAHEGVEVIFTMTGVQATVRHDSVFGLILRDFRRAQDGCTEKLVGPYPPQVLTLEERQSDERARIAATSLR